MPKSIKESVEESKKTSVGQLSGIMDRFKKADKVFGDEPVGKEVKFERVSRVSFSIPTHDLQLISLLVDRAIENHIRANNSEIIRAGVKALINATDEDFVKTLTSVEKVKKGIPLGSRKKINE